jgi:plasmid stabilization system protein ParE
VRRRVRRHLEVERDILDIGAWVARDNRESAIRFFDAVENAITSLRSMPGRGSPKAFRDPRLSGIRSLGIGGFPNHLVLYKLRGSEAYVLAVVHGARNYRRLLRGRLK